MHSSILIANKLIDIAKSKKQTLTPMQLIKLVFLCHGWMLGLYSRHLIKEPIEAWRYGPVISCLYQSVKNYKSSPVEYIGRENERNFCQLDDIENNLIQQVYDHYGSFSGIELSALTHQKDSPWYITWHQTGHINATISNDLIEYYYKNIAKEATNHDATTA